MPEKNLATIKYSIFTSILWLLLLTLGVQTIVGTLSILRLRASGLESAELKTFIESPIGLGGMSLISSVAVLLMLKRASKSFNRTDVWVFLGFKSIDKPTLLKVLFVGFVYYAFISLVLYLANIPTPEFMLDMKAQTNTFLDALFLLTAVLIIAPFIEEIVFRGIGFGRLKDSKIGVLGAIILPGVLFSVVHLQYEAIDILTILILSLLLGYVRYKTDNIWYCIAIHFQVNLLSTILLFMFE